MSVLVTIAQYPDNPEWLDLLVANRRRFCKLDHNFCIQHNVEMPGWNPSFGRVKLILHFLKMKLKVLWVDADAVLLNDITEADLTDRLAFAHDAGGINDGVFVTTPKDIPMWEIVQHALPAFKNNPTMVQPIVQGMNPIHDVLALDLWNARQWNNYAKIIHFAGEPNRFDLVKHACLKVANR